jgi:hypothetical protein
MRFLGALLITNSHLDGYYPISALATGGAIGNALFFFASGYCLTNINKPFFKWYVNRLLRIFPGVYIMSIILIALNVNFSHSLIQVLQIFIWPTYFWFVGAITLFYILYYLIVKYLKVSSWIQIEWVLAAVYLIIYFTFLDLSTWVIEGGGESFVEIHFKYIYYFMIMLCGAYIKKKPMVLSRGAFRFLIGAVSSIIMLYVHKELMNVYPSLLYTQGLNQLFVFSFVVCFAIWIENSKSICDRIQNRFGDVISRISMISLEIYLVQKIIIEKCINFSFPVNIIMVFVLILICARLLNFISVFCKRFLHSVGPSDKILD